MQDEDFLLIGKIVGVHGIKGAIKLYSYGTSYSVFQNGASLYIKKKFYEAPIKYDIIKVSSYYKQIIRINLKEVISRVLAEQLVSSDVFIKKSLLKKPEEGTYYWFQLIGLFVFKLDGELLGIVENVFSTGANDVLVVKNKGKEILIPFIKSVINEVNLNKKFLRVDLLDGLI